MGLPVIDDYHQSLKRIVQRISRICLSEEFLALTKELEILYSSSYNGCAPIFAYQDALYAIFAQEEIELSKMKA